MRDKFNPFHGGELHRDSKNVQISKTKKKNGVWWTVDEQGEIVRPTLTLNTFLFCYFEGLFVRSFIIIFIWRLILYCSTISFSFCLLSAIGILLATEVTELDL